MFVFVNKADLDSNASVISRIVQEGDALTRHISQKHSIKNREEFTPMFFNFTWTSN